MSSFLRSNCNNYLIMLCSSHSLPMAKRAMCIILKYLLIFTVKVYSDVTNEVQTITGGCIRFNCSSEPRSSVEWQFQRSGEDTKRTILFNTYYERLGIYEQTDKDYKSLGRYRMDIDYPAGRYDLQIENVTKMDEGFYTCTKNIPNENWKLNVLGEKELALDPTYVIESAGKSAIITFPTTRKLSIKLEHHSVNRVSPVDVYLDGRLINDYYAYSGRYNFFRSDDMWILTIKDVQESDAGTFTCSEDNGNGIKYVKTFLVSQGDLRLNYFFESGLTNARDVADPHPDMLATPPSTRCCPGKVRLPLDFSQIKQIDHSLCQCSHYQISVYSTTRKLEGAQIAGGLGASTPHPFKMTDPLGPPRT